MSPHWIHLGLGVALAALVYSRVIAPDMLFPWFAALLVLAILSTNSFFLDMAGAILGISEGTTVVIFLTIFLLTGIAVTLAYSVTRMRIRQAAIIRSIANKELDEQEAIAAVARSGNESHQQNISAHGGS